MSTLDKYRSFAQRVELFKGISPDDVARILAKGRVMQLRRGDTVFHKGTTGNTMFVVLAGEVALFDGRKNQLATFRTGDMFGEMALINQEPRSATAIVAEECDLFVLEEATFQRLLTKSVSVRMLLNIIATLSRRLRVANDRVTQLEQN